MQIRLIIVISGKNEGTMDVQVCLHDHEHSCVILGRSGLGRIHAYGCWHSNSVVYITNLNTALSTCKRLFHQKFKYSIHLPHKNCILTSVNLDQNQRSPKSWTCTHNGIYEEGEPGFSTQANKTMTESVWSFSWMTYLPHETMSFLVISDHSDYVSSHCMKYQPSKDRDQASEVNN